MMCESANNNENEELCFQVIRQEPILVSPCEATDDQPTPRIPFLALYFYARDEQMDDKDPIKVIREALAKVLVPYYPMAGRLRHAAGGKLCPDCNAQGVLFIEAKPDVSLSDFGSLKPPFSFTDQLIYHVPGKDSVTDTPLLLVQITHSIERNKFDSVNLQRV